MFIALSARVIVYRRTNKLGLSDHADKGLQKRMRAQANCAEYVLFGFVLMMPVELQNRPAIFIHGIAALLLIGRVAHGVGFSARPPIMILRVWGMILTLASYLLAISCIIILTLRRN